MSVLAARSSLLRRYLDELQVEPAAPSVEGLRGLHRAHVQRYAHDTLWKVRSRVPVLSAVGLVEALLEGEGGGCLGLNGSFAWLLVALGYVVQLHGARVQRAFDPAPGERRDAHAVLTVAVEGQDWYADVGMGNGLLDPLPLAEGSVEQEGGFTYRLERAEDPELGWRFHHDRRLMAIRTVESVAAGADLRDFRAHFRRDAREAALSGHVMVNRRREDGVTALVDATLVHRGAEGRSLHEVRSAPEWEAVLREEFLLALPGWSAEERDRLWGRVRAQRPPESRSAPATS